MLSRVRLMAIVCVFMFMLLPFYAIAQAGEPLYVEVGTLAVGTNNAGLLPDGSVVYFWEKTRPPTEEEKARRGEWFEAQWEAFRKQAEEEKLPKIKKETEEASKEMEKELSKRAPLTVKPLVPILSATVRGFHLLFLEAMKIGYPLARRHFINQPVVEEAGLRMWNPNEKKETKLLSVDVPSLYGNETWTRTPIDALNLIVSPDGKYIAMETKDGINLFKFDEGFHPVAQIKAHSPMGWSPDCRLFFVTKETGESARIIVLRMEDLKELIIFSADFDRVPFKSASVSSKSIIKSVAITNRLLAIALFTDLGIYNLEDGSLRLPDLKTIRKIGPPRGVVFSEDGKTLYVAGLRGFSVVNAESFHIIDQYITQVKDDFYFD
ncbi:hypothetical protein H5U35_01545, partial [Candidatus Aerophobetes bacterium]|nr:hypothetical protein [Candidatus Aerophobetes bacterium]